MIERAISSFRISSQNLLWDCVLLNILISSALLASDDEILKDAQCRLKFVEERENQK